MAIPALLEVKAIGDVRKMLVKEVALLAAKWDDRPEDEIHAGAARQDGLNFRRNIGCCHEASHGSRVDVLLVSVELGFTKKRSQMLVVSEAGQVLEEVRSLDAHVRYEGRGPEARGPEVDVQDGQATSCDAP